MQLTTLMLCACALAPLSSAQCLTGDDRPRSTARMDTGHLSLLSSQRQFSSDLLQVVAKNRRGANLLFSPLGVFNALLLVYFAAANSTLDSLQRTLHLAPGQDKVDILGAYNLNKNYQRLTGIPRNGCETDIANGIYLGKHLKPRYCIRRLLQEEFHKANFQKNPKNWQSKINKFVSEETHGLINDFMPKGTITSTTNLVVVNAAYFKGAWKNMFEKGLTAQTSFYLESGTDVPVTMMYTNATHDNKFKQMFSDDLQADVLDIPYASEDYSMFVVVPRDPSTVESTLLKMDSPCIEEMVRGMASVEAVKFSIAIPKFAIQTQIDLVPVLDAMGLGRLFSAADLSGLLQAKGQLLAFSRASHKALISVDEFGTEAAAVTDFMEARIGDDLFEVNRPFVYLIYNKASNLALFIGTFVHPGEGEF